MKSKMNATSTRRSPGKPTRRAGKTPASYVRFRTQNRREARSECGRPLQIVDSVMAVTPAASGTI
jgi:hypothetical protein